MSRQVDALIVGGGPAGAALATRLAEAGRQVILLERTKGPADKVCGEFLSRETVVHLRDLGVDPRTLGAVPINTLRLAHGRRLASALLPFSALSLSRRKLDEALLARAATAGAEIHRGVTVRALAGREGTWEARLDDGTAIAGRQAFLATGKHDLRGWKRPPTAQSDLIGLKMHWRLPAAARAEIDGGVEIALFPGGYAGLEPVENGAANLCLVVRRDRFAEIGQSWEALIEAIRAASPLLDRRLDGAQALWQRPLAVGFIPYGHLRRGGEGPWRLGDQAAVVPSFTGTGIGLALMSAALAADICLAGGSAADHDRALARAVGRLVRGGTTVSRLAMYPFVQGALSRAADWWPALLTAGARMTRLPLPQEERID